MGAIRPWQHVLDPLRGYLLLAQRLTDDRAYRGGWNFGPDPHASRDVGHQDRARVDQGGNIRRHVDLHASRIRTGTRSRSLQVRNLIEEEPILLVYNMYNN